MLVGNCETSCLKVHTSVRAFGYLNFHCIEPYYTPGHQKYGGLWRPQETQCCCVYLPNVRRNDSWGFVHSHLRKEENIGGKIGSTDQILRLTSEMIMDGKETPRVSDLCDDTDVIGSVLSRTLTRGSTSGIQCVL